MVFRPIKFDLNCSSISFEFLLGGSAELEKLLTKRTHFTPLDHLVIVEYKKKFVNDELYDDVEKIKEQDEK